MSARMSRQEYRVVRPKPDRYSMENTDKERPVGNKPTETYDDP
jgi:hypothetical protein